MTSESTPTLDSVCLFIEDCLHATAPIQEEGYPLIRTPNIGKGRLNFYGVHRVSQDTYDKWTRRARPEPGDLILAREAPAGNVALVREGEAVALGQRTVHLRPDPTQVDAEYLCYYLLTPKMQGALLAGETGATAKHVNMKDIRRLVLPGLHEHKVQHRLGRMIGVYDDLLEINQRRIKLLEDAARLIYREWFVRHRFPGHEHLETEAGVPKGWSKAPLGTLVAIRKGKNITKETVVEGEVPVVAGGLQPAYFHNTANVPGPAITVSASGANAGFVNLYHTDIWASDCSYISSDATPNIYFFFLLLRDRHCEIHAMQKGAAQPHVYPKDLERLVVLYPSDALLQEFAALVAPVFRQIRVLQDQSRKLGEARNLLLPRLMSGEVQI